MNAPIAGGETWQAVMDRAGGRCQCEGACGIKGGHRDPENPDATDRRCTQTGANGHPLHAVPRGAQTWPEAARLDADGLYALCDRCHRGVNTRRQRAARRATTTDEPTLF